MHEIRERTTVRTAEGEKVLLPGRITNAEAAEYGLTSQQPAPAQDAPEVDEKPAKAKASKKAAS